MNRLQWLKIISIFFIFRGLRKFGAKCPSWKRFSLDLVFFFKTFLIATITSFDNFCVYGYTERLFVKVNDKNE